MNTNAAVLFLGLLLLAGQASAGSMSCEGDGEFKGIYFSKVSTNMTSSSHVCVGDKEEFATDKRVVVDDNIRREDPDYQWQVLATNYYKVGGGSAPSRIYTEQIVKTKLGLAVLGKTEFEALLKKRRAEAEQNPRVRFEPLLETAMVPFTCRIIDAQDYIAPCDKPSKDLEAILAGRVAPMSDDDVVESVAAYVQTLLQDRRKNQRAINDLMERVTGSKWK